MPGRACLPLSVSLAAPLLVQLLLLLLLPSVQQKWPHLAVQPRETKPVLLRIVVDALSLTPLLFLLPLIVPPAVNPLPVVFPHPLLRLLFALAAASSDASQMSSDSGARPAEK